MTRRELVVGLVGVVLVVAGAVVMARAPSPTGSFAWFSYERPPDGTSLLSGATLVTRRFTSGAALDVAGALLLAGLLGYRLGRRARG